MTVATSLTYILPIKSTTLPVSSEFATYVQWLAALPGVELVVIDDSPANVFDPHHALFAADIIHERPAADLVTPMGKVGSVLTGVRLAAHEHLIIADDDVRYDERALHDVIASLHTYDVVRPQNYFDPLPWHARWDTARMLLNRMTGGDWPGTLGVRRSALRATNGYDGDVMFENLELVRTIRAAGGTDAVLLDVFVRRHPPSSRHFWSQRVRQAYDEIARPLRLTVQLAILPLFVAAIAVQAWSVLAAAIIFVMLLAEAGRRRGGGARMFPFTSSLLAPVWLAERGVCVWLALASHVRFGGIRYHGRILTRAATPMRVLKARHAGAYRAARHAARHQSV